MNSSERAGLVGDVRSGPERVVTAIDALASADARRGRRPPALTKAAPLDRAPSDSAASRQRSRRSSEMSREDRRGSRAPRSSAPKPISPFAAADAEERLAAESPARPAPRRGLASGERTSAPASARRYGGDRRRSERAGRSHSAQMSRRRSVISRGCQDHAEPERLPGLSPRPAITRLFASKRASVDRGQTPPSRIDASSASAICAFAARLRRKSISSRSGSCPRRA